MKTVKDRFSLGFPKNSLKNLENFFEKYVDKNVEWRKAGKDYYSLYIFGKIQYEWFMDNPSKKALEDSRQKHIKQTIRDLLAHKKILEKHGFEINFKNK